jgi:hypothetical protein
MSLDSILQVIGQPRDLVSLGSLGLILLLFIGSYVAVRRGFRPALRRLGAYDAINTQVGRAIESGGRIHISTGPNSLIDEHAMTTIAALHILDSTVTSAAISDKAPIATTGDATTLPVVADTVRGAFKEQGASFQNDRLSTRLVAYDPLTLAGGLTAIMRDEDIQGNVLVGSFGPEIALALEAGKRNQASQTVGSDQIAAQAAAYPAAEHLLIGEEMFSARAYVEGRASGLASLLTQDLLRWAIVGAVVVGVVLKTLGIL